MVKNILIAFLLLVVWKSVEVKSNESGYCAPYNGKICKSHITGQVWYPSTRSGGWENEEITTGLFSELITELEGMCEIPAQKLLCAYAFPRCKYDGGSVYKLPLCYEDCIAVQKLFCYNDWVLIEQNKEKGKFLKTRGHFRLPECDELPRHNKSEKQPTCSYVGLTEMNEAEKSCKFIILSYRY
jgi:muscle, skeletal, receptor tyrosine kinase